MDLAEFSGALFGGQIKIAFYGIEQELAEPIFKEAYKEALALQKKFNFFDSESELSLLNKVRKMKVSDELFEVLEKALEYGKLTNGAYDITIGKQIRERKAGKELPKVDCSYKDVKLGKEVKPSAGGKGGNDTERSNALGEGKEVSLEHYDIILDLGSIAKGYIADKVGEYLKNEGVDEFFIDARGDLIASGEHEESIAIQHPRIEEELLPPIYIKNSAVATSGDYKQYYGDYKKSHILGQKELISVTVVAPTLMEADVFASAVFLLDLKEREELIEKNPNYKVFVINEKLEEKSYNGFEGLRNKGK